MSINRLTDLEELEAKIELSQDIIKCLRDQYALVIGENGDLLQDAEFALQEVLYNLRIWNQLKRQESSVGKSVCF